MGGAGLGLRQANPFGEARGRQLCHGKATTNEAVRRAILLRQGSVRALPKRHGVSPRTIQKRRKRSTTADAPMRPKVPRSTVLTSEEEAMIVAVRRYTLPLGDCLYGPSADHSTLDRVISTPLP